MRSASLPFSLARILALFSLLPSLTAGCGGSTEPPTAAFGVPSTSLSEPRFGLETSSGSPLERYFPLVDGHVYSYRTESDKGEVGVIITRAARTGITSGELRYPTGVKRFEYTPQGIVTASTGAFVLKSPTMLGASWRGEHGSVTRVTAVDASAHVPAGRFTGCIQTLEERGGDRPVRYTTTFCPDVGIVLLEVASGGALERAELKSYAVPVHLGPDGLERTKIP